jgi:hypothetical protein
MSITRAYKFNSERPGDKTLQNCSEKILVIAQSLVKLETRTFVGKSLCNY